LELFLARARCGRVGNIGEGVGPSAVFHRCTATQGEAQAEPQPAAGRRPPASFR
jgi:hypothetical protein